VVKLFKKLPEVKDASPTPKGMILFGKIASPNDPHYQNGDQWGLNGAYGINAPVAWDISKGDGVTIGIIDEGVDRSHWDLFDKIWSGEMGYFGRHGTCVAGIAAATTNNGIGIAGVGWESPIYPTCYVGLEDVASDIRAAADDGVNVMNFSWGHFNDYPFIKSACRYAYNAGIVLVAGSGDDQLAIPWTCCPAAYDSFCIAVGAITKQGNRWGKSNYGDWLDVMAPGDTIWTTAPSDSYALCRGTSFATPFVSGIAALILSAHPSYSPDRVKWKICESCVDMGAEGWDDSTGHGRVRAPEALGIEEQDSKPLLALSFSLFQNYPNPFNPITTIAYDLSQDSPVNLAVYNPLGEEVATLVDKAQKAGHHSIQWNANNTASGIYFYRLRAADFVKTRRMLLVK